MRKIADGLHWVAVTLWVGGLWAVGYIAAPTLFANLPDRGLAGALAGKLFTVIAYVGLVCGAYLLSFRLLRFGGKGLRQIFFWVALLMVALTAVGQFGIQPIMASLKQQALPAQVMDSVLRDRFASWHGISSGLYLVQSLLGLVLVVLQKNALR